MKLIGKIYNVFSKKERMWRKANRLEDEGKISEAFEIRKELYEYVLNRFGEDNIYILKCMMNLSLSYQAIKDYDKSFELREKCYEGALKLLGRERSFHYCKP